MPSSLRRFLRARVRVAAVGVLALALLGSALLQGGAAAALKQSVDPSWRGVYDILVTPAGVAGDGAADRATMLAPGMLDPLGPRMSRMTLDDVQRLRALDGVEVAAPIGHVVLPNTGYSAVRLSAPIAEQQTTAPLQSYRATVRLITDDGLGERLVSEQRYSVAVDHSGASSLPEPGGDAAEPQMCTAGPVSFPCELYDWWAERSWSPTAWVEQPGAGSFAWGVYDAAVRIDLPTFLVRDQRIALVDPRAEATLLGPAGAFLEPLLAFGGEAASTPAQLAAWAAERATDSQRLVGQMLAEHEARKREIREGAAYAEYARLMAERGEEPRLEDFLEPEQHYVPVLSSSSPPGVPLRVEIALEGFGAVSPPVAGSYSPPLFPQPLQDGEPGTAIATVSGDASALFDAFSGRTVEFHWPDAGDVTARGVSAEEGARVFSIDEWVLADAAAPTQQRTAPDGARTARVEGLGFRSTAERVGPGSAALSAASIEAEPRAPGSEAVFSTPFQADPAQPASELPMAGVIVGDFDRADLAAIGELANGVPLGAYESPAATLVRTADGSLTEPTAITPAGGALGLLGAETGAIADIRSARWGAGAVVEAVRVRAAGVSGYDAAGIATVTELARAIEEAGFTATIVAGSHTETVSVGVGGYAFGTMDGDGGQRVGDLGVVEQRWTVLGAAAASGTGVSAAAMLLLGFVLAAVLGLLAAVELCSVPARRREAELLRALGWRRSRVIRWIAADSLIGLALLLAAAALGLALSAERAVTALGAGAGLAAALTVSAVAVARAVRQADSPAVGPAELSRAIDRAYRPQVRHTGSVAVHAEVGPGEPPAASAARPARVQHERLPRSAAAWGLQRAWRRPASTLARTGTVFVVMGTVAVFSMLVAQGAAQQGSVLALCGLAAATVCVLVLRAEGRRDGRELREALAAGGWTARDAGWAVRADLLVLPLAAVLLGGYLLSFLLQSLALAPSNAAVSAAIVAGLATVLLLSRKVVAEGGDTA